MITTCLSYAENKNADMELHSAIQSADSWILESGFLTEERKYITRDKKLRTIVRRLIQQGHNPTAQNHNGETTLHLALNYPLTFKLLLENGADPNIPNNKKETVFHLAHSLWDPVSHNYSLSSRIAEQLLEHGADPHILNDRGKSVWQVWLESSKHMPLTTIKQFVLKGGINPSVPDSDNNTALHWLVRRQPWSVRGSLRGEEYKAIIRDKRLKEVVQFLLDNGADPIAKNKKEETALDLAVGNPLTAQLLLERGAKPTGVTFNNWLRTGDNLHLSNGHITLSIAKSFIKNGTHPNIPDRDGNMALHSVILGARNWKYIAGFLAEENHVIVRDKRLKKVVQFLLDNGADPIAKNTKGETALGLADGNPRTKKLLQSSITDNSCHTVFKQ